MTKVVRGFSWIIHAIRGACDVRFAGEQEVIVPREGYKNIVVYSLVVEQYHGRVKRCYCPWIIHGLRGSSAVSVDDPRSSWKTPRSSWVIHGLC